jgi:hypothetical protein
MIAHLEIGLGLLAALSEGQRAIAHLAADCARLPPLGSIEAPSLSCALPTETAGEGAFASRSRDGSVGELVV